MAGWPGGSFGSVTVTNTTSARLKSWTVQLAMPSGQTVANVWNGSRTGGTGTVSVKNAFYNGTLEAGGTQMFGLVTVGNGSGSPKVVGCTPGGASFPSSPPAGWPWSMVHR